MTVNIKVINYLGHNISYKSVLYNIKNKCKRWCLDGQVKSLARYLDPNITRKVQLEWFVKNKDSLLGLPIKCSSMLRSNTLSN